MKSQENDVTKGEVLHEKGCPSLQYICAISASLAVMSCGIHTGWTSPALPFLWSMNTPIKVTQSEGSWLTSVYYLSNIIGCLLLPFIIDRIGRKKTLLLFSIPQIIGCLMIILAKDYKVLLVGRIILGISAGGTFDFNAVYLGEIADKKIRGQLVAISKLSFFVGNFFVKAVGSYVSYDNLNRIIISVPLLFIVTFVFMPESPYYCIIRGKDKDAEKIIMKFRGVRKPESVSQDIKEMKNFVKSSQKPKWTSLKELIGSRMYLKNLTILLLSKMTKHLSGLVAIASYTQEIFSFTNSSLAPEYSATIVSGLQIIISALTLGLVDRFGRKVPFLLSGITETITLGLMGLFFFFKIEEGADISSISWVPLMLLIGYEVAFCLGVGPVSYLLQGELFPVDVKGTAIALGSTIEALCSFSVGIGFHALNNAVGIYSTFWIFGACSFTGTLLLFFIMPETKGKSLEEIQKLFKNHKTSEKT